MVGILRRLLPTSAKHRLKRAFNRVRPNQADADRIAGFAPSSQRGVRRVYALDAATQESPPGPDGLPVPPANLRMGYGTASDQYYCEEGRQAAQAIREALLAKGAVLDECRLLELGCASGRVLRHFRKEAEVAEVWGADPHEDSILWAKANLSPPFRFATSTRYPHLPFEDAYFDVVYGISVFTHVEFLVDLWLLELRRIVKPGGFVLVTVHNEDSIAHLLEHGHPPWLSRGVNLRQLLNHDVSVAPWGVPGTAARHDAALVFYQTDYLRREWGHYFDVADIQPCAVDRFQSLVVMRRPNS